MTSMTVIRVARMTVSVPAAGERAPDLERHTWPGAADAAAL